LFYHHFKGEWLNAHLFISSFRPIALEEFILMDCEVFEMDGVTINRDLPLEFILKSDIKGLIG
jgi:hypothetical protein